MRKTHRNGLRTARGISIVTLVVACALTAAQAIPLSVTVEEPDLTFDVPVTANYDGGTIAEINQRGGLLVEDKLFSDFSIISVAAGATAIAPDESLVEITPILVNGDVGIQFNGPWIAGPDSVVNSTITFKVSIVEPWREVWRIHDNTFTLTASNVDMPGGFITGIENVFDGLPALGRRVASKSVFDTYVDDKLIDHQIFTDPDTGQPVALTEIWVKKDITLFGGTFQDNVVGAPGGDTVEFGFTHLSEFTQTFSQIPEPATMAMLAFGGMLVAVRRRKQRT